MTKFYMLVGCPGVGKSTFSESMSECVVVNLDEIRAELYGDASIQGDGRKVAEIGRQRVLSALALGKNVVYDACNVQRRYRKPFLAQLPENVEKIAVYFDIPLELCLERNAKRDRVVPREVIENMHAKFQVPQFDEGFDRIMCIYG